jgi:hypothetical protein
LLKIRGVPRNTVFSIYMQAPSSGIPYKLLLLLLLFGCSLLSPQSYNPFFFLTRFRNMRSAPKLHNLIITNFNVRRNKQLAVHRVLNGL